VRNRAIFARHTVQDVFAYVMSRKRKLELAVEIARSLRELARTGIVHLDWKPSNILAVARSGTHDAEHTGPLVKLIDFGDATMATREHEPTKTLDYTTGTPGYSAPESEYGIALLATDVFSVGVTILELWVGCLWNGATSERGYQKERMWTLQKVERSDPMVARILAECLRPDPATRPTATQLLDRLKKIQKSC
jgi:serine/threonine protein kinase